MSGSLFFALLLALFVSETRAGNPFGFLHIQRVEVVAPRDPLFDPPVPKPEKKPSALDPKDRKGWKTNITSTIFWVGEPAVENSPSNVRSAWDSLWEMHYGGYDSPQDSLRTCTYLPSSFKPSENPFYVALPYSDVVDGKFRPEAPAVIPWFRQAYKGEGISVCKGHWVCICAKGKLAFAQWEDVGPFETNNWAYVFGPVPAPTHGHNDNAGIDVSPAIRTYLRLNGLDKVNWRFVDADQVQEGPWSTWKK